MLPLTLNPEIAEQARGALRRHVLEPWASRCIDREYGGFLVDFDERWNPAGPHDKTLEHASRSTMALALLHQALPGEGCDVLARHGCAFLQSALWDSAHGGFFAQVDRSGAPSWDGLKHPHAVTYAAEAFLLAESCLAPNEGRRWATRAMQWLDDVAWDQIHGGYWGSFRRNNERYLDGAPLPTADGRDMVGLSPGFKEANTFGDSIESLTWFVTLGVGGRCAERLAFLVDLVVNRLTCDPVGMLPYLYRRDWQPVPDLMRVGLQFQMVHRLISAAAALGFGTAAAVARACDLADFCLAKARHPEGGFCLAVSADGRQWPGTGPSSDLRQWWVQLEAVRAFGELATHADVDPDARDRYARACEEQWAFTRDHYFDTKFGGIRELPVRSNRTSYKRLFRFLKPPANSPQPRRLKTHGWKDPLHEVGVFIALSESLSSHGS
jgi:mannose/cellobiose epimerase-like protein (N-acyl-D-glucosamine 2-epimerase family)